MESDIDDSCLESDNCRATISDPPKPGRVDREVARKNRRSDYANIGIPNNISTHSLNEADLVVGIGYMYSYLLYWFIAISTFIKNNGSPKIYNYGPGLQFELNV